MKNFRYLTLPLLSCFLMACSEDVPDRIIIENDPIIIDQSMMIPITESVDSENPGGVTLDNFFAWGGEMSQSDRQLIDENWKPSYIPLIIEMAYISGDERFARDAFSLITKKTGTDHGLDMDAWHQFIWENPPADDPLYVEFKKVTYQFIDESFGNYFDDNPETLIRLDEVVWGGVKRDGIPPLENPDMISAEEADYLEDDNVVFGLEINGDARAYPKRILAWHEMFRDSVGGISVNGVYCTLCGSMILYETEFDGKDYKLGTSGFLYRSNKLMYDEETFSLWSTLDGKPVVGPLVGEGIELTPRYVVTTTWGRWKEMHPETTVLSLETGHDRDYGEGVAYRDYFATDELMFGVPFRDDRLRNKDEVLALRFGDDDAERKVIAADFLTDNPLYQGTHGSQDFVILTDVSGANRIYERSDFSFESYDGDVTVTDSDGGEWSLDEVALTNGDGVSLRRLPAHRAFWFGWYAAFPDTVLIHE